MSMLPEALRLLRVLHDLKSAELADKLGISPSYLSEIESGKKEPTLAFIRKFADVFKTTPGSLLFFSEELDEERKGIDPKTRIRKKAIQFLQRIENSQE
jgi:transcriptional regulator with XRE-family HTH domain